MWLQKNIKGSLKENCKDMRMHIAQALLFYIQKDDIQKYSLNDSVNARVSLQGVESLWGDCRFIPADWGS